MLMRWIAAACLCAALIVNAPSAHADATGIPVQDPREFALTVTQQIARDHMMPIRETMRQMLGSAALSADLEGNIVVMERYLEGARGDEVTRLEDITLAGTLRRIYYLNQFESKLLFTRLDFTRTPRGWLLTSITFGSNWNAISPVAETPGWTVNR